MRGRGAARQHKSQLFPGTSKPRPDDSTEPHGGAPAAATSPNSPEAPGAQASRACAASRPAAARHVKGRGTFARIERLALRGGAPRRARPCRQSRASRARHRHRSWRSATARRGARHVARIERLVERLAGLARLARLDAWRRSPPAARHRAGIEGAAPDRPTGIGPAQRHVLREIPLGLRPASFSSELLSTIRPGRPPSATPRLTFPRRDA
jgi:hypothetical protein